MSASKWQARTRRELIIEVWEDLDCESVGARELEQIQQALCEKFGEGALESPAAIARVVADEGGVLRHPEVFECDLNWRKQRLINGGFNDELDFSKLTTAFSSIIKIEQRRIELQTTDDTGELDKLKKIVSGARSESILLSRSKILDSHDRDEAREVSNWLTVWLQSPELFSDWLDLRRRSPEFRKKFKTEDEP